MVFYVDLNRADMTDDVVLWCVVLCCVVLCCPAICCATLCSTVMSNQISSRPTVQWISCSSCIASILDHTHHYFPYQHRPHHMCSLCPILFMSKRKAKEIFGVLQWRLRKKKKRTLVEIEKQVRYHHTASHHIVSYDVWHRSITCVNRPWQLISVVYITSQ